MHFAIISEQPDAPEIVESLLEAGANPNLQTADGNTPLHLAVRENAPQIIQILLAHGADPNIENRHGQKPVDLIKEHVEHTRQKIEHAQQKIAEGQEHLQITETVQKLLEQNK